MTIFSAAFRREALLLLVLGAAPKNGAYAFVPRPLVPPTAINLNSRRSSVRATSVPLYTVSPADDSHDVNSDVTVAVPGSKRAAASAMAKLAINGLATHASKTVPSALMAGVCIGAFPQSAMAFTGKDYISHATTARNLIGAGIAAATSAQVIRVARIPRQGGSALSMSSSADATVIEAKKPGKIPITVLAGFLGAGKTTALKRLLENTEGIKVGTIVNDIASVNIDAKLISNPMNSDGMGSNNAVGKSSSGGTVELQNGCACCSLSDELLASVTDLMEGRDLDAIVVELSGVADPAAVRQNWEQAVETDHPATEKADLGRIVTVVDSHTFGSDWMTWDTAGQRKWSAEDDKCAEQRQIPELLAEQVEAADVIILNKIDLSEGEQLDTARLVVQSLNKEAELIETKFGEMTPEKIIGNVAKILEEDDNGHSHDHGSCSDPECADTSHSHSHDHSSEASCEDPICTDSSHSHSHDHSSEKACLDPDCSDTSHSHSHDHSSEAACTDADCSDTSHSHSHDHKATTTDSLGISNFVYKSSRPFDPVKLQKLLLTWPIPVLEELNLVELSEQVYSDENSPFVGVLRSKGFAWIAPSIMAGPFNDLTRHDTAIYWSHAGKHFGLKEAGSWWASMGKEAMKKVFEGNLDEYERIIKEDFVSGEWGDRRQEIVFIGAKLDEEGIRDALDTCLCTDEQIGDYKQAILDAIAEYYDAPAPQ